MEKIIIYTNEQCPYCKIVKEELTKNEIKFENKFTKDFIEEWDGVVGLTGSAQVPTIFYKDNYFHSKYPNKSWKSGREVFVMFYKKI